MDELDLLISDDLDKVASLEAQLLDVEAALEDLAVQDGVCRANMTSFESHLPEDYPLTSFTKKPTHTNLSVAQVTLEGIHNNVLVALAVAVSALIARLVGWFLDRYKKRRADKRVPELRMKLEKLSDKYAKQDIPSSAIPKNEWEELLAPFQDKFNEKYNAFAESCLYLSPFVRETYAIQEDVYDTVLPKLLDFSDYYDQLLKETDNPVSLMSQVHTAGQYFKMLVEKLTKTFKDVKMPREEITNFHGLVKHLNNEKQRLKSEPPTKTMVFTQFAETAGLSEPFRSPSINELTNARHRYDDARVSRNMKQLDKVSKQLGKKNSPRSSDPTLRKGLEDFLRILNSEIQAIFQYSALLDEMEDTEIQFYSLVVSFREKRNEFVEELLKSPTR